MKLSYKWLSKYLELDLEPKDLAERLNVQLLKLIQLQD